MLPGKIYKTFWNFPIYLSFKCLKTETGVVVGAISLAEDWIVGEIYSAVVFLFFPSFKLYIIFASLFQTIFIGTFSIYIILVIPIKNSSVNRKKTGRNIVVVVVFKSIHVTLLSALQ